MDGGGVIVLPCIEQRREASTTLQFTQRTGQRVPKRHEKRVGCIQICKSGVCILIDHIDTTVILTSTLF